MSNLFSMNGKVIVVTGGAGYLGNFMVKELLEHGGIVAIADIVDKTEEEIIGAHPQIQNLHVYKCDLSSSEAIAEMFKKVRSDCGKIDVLVNCAAFGGVPAVGRTAGSVIGQISDEVFRKVVEGTLDVTFQCTREVLPYFEENGKGNIINIASMYGMVSPDPGIYGTSGQNSPPMYGAGKAGILQLTRYCAGNLASRNIRVNSITPGPFPNPLGLKGDEFKKKLEAKTMLGRIGRPEELTGALMLLASEASSYMTGANIVVDGGWTAW